MARYFGFMMLPRMIQKLYRFDLAYFSQRDPDYIWKWTGGDICSCLVVARTGSHQSGTAVTCNEHAPLFAAHEREPVMLDGLRMGVFYDIVQHMSYGCDSHTSWRVLWDPKQLDALIKSPPMISDGTHDIFMGQTQPGTARRRSLPRQVTVPVLQELMKEADGPILQLFVSRRLEDDTSIRELQFQVQFRFPLGNGMQYANYWHGVYPGGVAIEDGTISEIETFDQELDERDKLLARKSGTRAIEGPDLWDHGLDGRRER